MIHCKKLALDVEPQLLNIEDAIPKPKIAVNSYSQMDAEMSKILKETSYGPYDKWLMYDQVLKKYLRQLKNHKEAKSEFLSHAINNVPGEMEHKDQDLNEKKIKTPPINLTEYLQQYTVGTASIKAKLLYSLLQACASISWDDVGRVLINGNHTGSCIKDYIDASMKKKITDKPLGWETYVQMLKKLKVPHSYVNNIDLQSELKTENITHNFQITTPYAGEQSSVGPSKTQHNVTARQWRPYK
jgi:hypothetical protein